MKADKKTLQMLAESPRAVHNVKVDYKKLVELELLQIPERNPDPIKVTKKLMKYLEELPLPEQNGIKVDYTRLEEFECPKTVVYSPYLFMKKTTIAACLLFGILSVAFFTRPWNYMHTKVTETVNTSGTITVTRMSDSKMYKASAEVTVTKEPEPTEEPVITEEPVVTKEPVITEEPTETPTLSPTPKSTTKPTPNTTIKQTPKPTSKPKTTKKSTKKSNKKVSKDGWVSLGNGWTITYYCPLSCCNGKYAGKTSTGAKMRPNHTIAVDPSVIPYGTHVKIDGKDYEFVAEDCGGKIRGKHIDVLVENCSIARRLGTKRNVKVWIKK